MMSITRPMLDMSAGCICGWANVPALAASPAENSNEATDTQDEN